ncbi:MAG: helix-turn-helix domain-containing protein, partial [bacterium]|nr:helix-turn-helix domain-containing protein [bacterium]
MDKMKDIGESLKKEREKRDISLEYISSGTNISVNALTSLENGELEQIPGVFYLKNYIKTYLDAIGADSDRFFAEHDQELNSACKDKIETGKPYYTKLKYSRFRKRRVVFSLVLTAIVFVLVFYSLYSNKDNIFGGWNLNRRDIPVPQTGIDFTAGGFPSNSSRDYSPVNITIEFSRQCWTQVYRGKE